jgi:hypothetical protein
MAQQHIIENGVYSSQKFDANGSSNVCVHIIPETRAVGVLQMCSVVRPRPDQAQRIRSGAQSCEHVLRERIGHGRRRRRRRGEGGDLRDVSLLVLAGW